MTEFRLTQISDTHLSRADRFASLTENFHRISAHIDAARPDLVVNSGDVSWDGPTNRSDLEFAKELHDGAAGGLPLPARQSRRRRQPDGARRRAIAYGKRKGLCRLHRSVRRGPLAVRSRRLALHWAQFADHEHGNSERAEQDEWLQSQLSGANGKPIALFLHKPLFLMTPDDPEESGTAIRYVPQPVRSRLDRDARRA